MPGVLLEVDPQAYSAAAIVFGDDIVDRLVLAADDLAHRLSSCTTMAGSDPAGLEWAASYDPVAKSVAASVGECVNACLNVAALLQASGFNHDATDAPDSAAVPSFAEYAYRTISPPTVPPLDGGDGGEPSGWSLIAHAVGYVWPNGHQDRLHSAAAAWRSAASSLEAAADLVPGAVRGIEAQVSPEVEAAAAVCRGMADHIRSIAMAMRGLAGACETYAHFLDEAHSAAEHELAELIEWTVGIEVVGGIFAFFTAGLSEAGAQLAEASRIAVTAARIGAILARFSTSVRVVRGLSAVGEGAARTVVALREVRLRRPAFVPDHPIPGFPLLNQQAGLAELQRNAALGDQAIGNRRVDVSSPKTFDPATLRGLTMQEVMDSIPPDWDIEPSTSGGGIVYLDPRRRGRQLRIMPGYPKGSRPDPVTWGPYVQVSQNGVKEQKVALYGNPTLR